QRDLAEVVAGAEPPDLVTVDGDSRRAVLDHEEADAAFALDGDLLAGGERSVLHRSRDRLSIPVVEVGEEGNLLQELCRFARHARDSIQVPTASALRSFPAPCRASRGRGGEGPRRAPRA